ncbi:MAG TPA: protein-methionine-sulfoxide reductase catalytic subunit MsrP [Candidatus Binatia bacterium]
MSNRIERRGRQFPGKSHTSLELFRERRLAIKAAGILGLGLIGEAFFGCGPAKDALTVGAQEKPPAPEIYPATINVLFDLDRPVTDELYAASYNNFYEFSTFKGTVYKKAARLRTYPWQVDVGGLVPSARVFDIDELVRALPIEERFYRFRCVEAWAMAVPWTGFPLHALIKRIQPLSAAKFVRFISFFKPEDAPNQSPSHGPWPYTEGLTMAEAMNELTFVATGIYGHPLPKQHGAPLRLVVPWKYGFKSIKSIAKIEFTAEQPRTFWNSIKPNEYGFTANVDPNVPHPRWSQKTERLIDTGERRATLSYNGYADWVAGLYS